ncbi:translocation/assembly module TamB domain-containing protein [Cytophaga aurantiaca]|uniref:translocation/assembly module TamB domain-containing protein n=1 Tax=Cytophaga aurantiaca TaxID=29530 RepID=UPI001FDFB8F8|nr:translocation/assembly module TamB [Cytophaga aurantiaca]
MGIIGLFLVLFGSLWLILKVPAVQNFLVSKATSYVSNKTHTRVELKYIDLAFPKSILLQGIFLEDTNHDTLVAVKELEVNINMLALLTKTVSIETLELDTFYIQLKRNNQDSTFNYQFLVNAFTSDKTKEVDVDTSSGEPWTIKANDLVLTHGRFNMTDAVSGLNMSLSIGTIEAELNKLDLEKSSASIGDVHLSEVHGNIQNTKPAAIDTTSDTNSWNAVELSELTIQQSSFNYSDVSTAMLVSSNIGQLELDNTTLDLYTQKIVSNGLSINKSNGSIDLKTSETTSNSDSNEPGWNIQVKAVDMKQCAFKMNILNEDKIKKGIDWNHLALTSINTSINDIVYNSPLIQASVESFSAQDKSGFSIRSLHTDAYMDAHKASLSNLSLETNHSRIGQDIKISYSSLEEITSSLALDCSMRNNQVAVKDVLLLVPDLDTIEIIRKNKNRVATFDFIAKGNLDQLNIKHFYIKTLESTIDTKGQLRYITDPNKLYIDLAFNRIQTGASDLTALLPDSTLPVSIQVPAEIYAKGNYKGTLSDFRSTMDMSSSSGNAFIDADIKDLQKEIPSYNLTVHTHSFDLGKLLNQSSLGILNGSADIKGSGLDTNTIQATIHSDIESLRINSYVYHNIHLDGTIDSMLIDATGEINDENIKASLVAKADLTKANEFYDAQLNLKGADLRALGISTEHVTVAANTDLHLKGDPSENIDGHISSRNILVIQNGKKYKEDSLILVSLNEPGKSSVKMNSSMFAANFEGNIDIFSVSDAVMNHMNRYFRFTDTKFQKTRPQNFSFEIQLNDSPILREVVLPALTEYNPMTIAGSFNSEEAKLTIDANIPLATYDGTRVTDLTFKLDSDPKKMSYLTGWQSLTTGSIHLEQTTAEGNIQNDTTGVNITIKNTEEKKKDKGKDKIRLNAFITSASEGHYRFSIYKDGLALQERQWTVAEKNYIEIGNKYIFADNFNLSHANQFIKLQSANKGDDIDLQFGAFNLHALSQIIEDDTLLVQGILNGEINFKNIQQNPAFTSKLTIKDLSYKKSRVGNLLISADNLTAERYTARIELSDSTNRAVISGYYLSSDEKSALNFNANIQTIHLNVLEAFSGGQLSNSTGKVKGNIDITGSVKKPIFNGNLQFINASSKIAFINQRLFMKKENITIDPEKITFNSFNILDSLNNEAVVNGYVGIKELDNITFNLDIHTKNFTVLNTTAANNKLYYGKVILDSKISVKGDQDLPIIIGDIDIVRGSHFTFAIPDSKVSVDRGDGIVIFTSDSSSLDPIMLRQIDEEDKSQRITGINLAAKIHIDRNSTLKLLVDPISGDSLSVRGDADLNFKMYASGQTSLSGTYVVYDGSYKASLENVFVRKFNISKGSTIIWSGDPVNALVDIKATYTTKTAPDGLLSNTGVIDSSALRKPLPFIVVMSMQGELLKPLISFQLDMPDNAKGAMGGQVYSQITAINANESEVNKQVFALLALNKFIASDNSSSGGSSDFARRSVSRMMSNELNKLSAKYVEGLQIDVDVQSYNAVNNGQQQGNTQVEVGVTKSLFDERLSVEIGGNVPIEGQDATASSNAKNITGDVKVEYKLTKNGRYKVKAFRVNQYDGISNGTIIETGAGIMYVRDFTHFKELFISERKRKKMEEGKQQ